MNLKLASIGKGDDPARMAALRGPVQTNSIDFKTLMKPMSLGNELWSYLNQTVNLSFVQDIFVNLDFCLFSTIGLSKHDRF